MKNPGLTRRMLQTGAHPFVQTAKRNTPAQVARNKGNVATLDVLLPSLLLEQLIAKYPLAKRAIQTRFENHTKASR